MKRVSTVVYLAAVACGSSSHDKNHDAAVVDTMADASGSGSATSCYGSGVVQVCFGGSGELPVPTASYDLVSTQRLVLDTTKVDDADCAALQMQADGTKVCVIAGTTVTLSGKLETTGANALVVVALGALQVNRGATIELEARGLVAGAGGDAPECGSASPGGAPDRGAAGGLFIGAGGSGGDGETGLRRGAAGRRRQRRGGDGARAADAAAGSAWARASTAAAAVARSISSSGVG